MTSERFRFLVENAESLCCGALVYEQVYPLKDVFHPLVTGTRSFMECDRCYNRCSVLSCKKIALHGPSSIVPSVTTIQQGSFTDDQLVEFVTRFRAYRPSILLSATLVGAISRYSSKETGDSCVSLRTDQQVCPIAKRTHGSNSVVIRFNLTRKTFSVGCYCSPKPFFHCEMVMAHPYNCECFPCFKSELAEIYEHE